MTTFAERVANYWATAPGCPDCGGPLDIDWERTVCVTFGCDVTEEVDEDI